MEVSWLIHKTASAGDASILDIWWVWGTPSVPLLPGLEREYLYLWLE